MAASKTLVAVLLEYNNLLQSCTAVDLSPARLTLGCATYQMMQLDITIAIKSFI